MHQTRRIGPLYALLRPRQGIGGRMTPSSDNPPADRLLTKQDVAARLNVSTRTVQRLHLSGELKALRVGGSVRFHPDDVDAYVQQLRADT
jgi:excisionase family DNA binding protein